MNRRLPSRGPRVMNGIAALAAQARDLQAHGPAQAGVLGLPTAAEHAARMADLAALVARCMVAEQRVKRACEVLEAFTKQAQQLPEDHSARKLAEQILVTFKEALK